MAKSCLNLWSLTNYLNKRITSSLVLMSLVVSHKVDRIGYSSPINHYSSVTGEEEEEEEAELNRILYFLVHNHLLFLSL